jgi:hypothetical protein
MIESTAASFADAAPIVRPSSSRYPPSNINADGLDTELTDWPPLTETVGVLQCSVACAARGLQDTVASNA